MQCEDPDGIDCADCEQTAIPELRVPLEVEAEERVYFADRGHWEIQIAGNIVGELDCQHREEAFLYPVDEQLAPYVRQYDDALVCLGDGKDLQVGYSFGAEVLQDFDQL